MDLDGGKTGPTWADPSSFSSRDIYKTAGDRDTGQIRHAPATSRGSTAHGGQKERRQGELWSLAVWSTAALCWKAHVMLCGYCRSAPWRAFTPWPASSCSSASSTAAGRFLCTTLTTAPGTGGLSEMESSRGWAETSETLKLVAQQRVNNICTYYPDSSLSLKMRK